MPLDMPGVMLAGAAAQTATGLLGMGLQNTYNQQAFGNQQALQQQQLDNQRNLNKQGQKIQQENWDYTNYENQRKHMENAGLNVGLMYGMGGGGGQSMGASGGASAASASAPPVINPMSQAPSMMNIADTMANVELKKAQATNLNAQTEKLTGVDTEKTGAETGLITSQAEKTKLESAFLSGNMQNAIESAKQVTQNQQAENARLVAQGKLTQIDADNEQRKLNAEIGRIAIENTLTRAQTNNTIQLTEESKQKIVQKWKEIEQSEQHLNQEQQRIKIEAFKAELEAEYPGVGNTIGKILNDIQHIGLPKSNVELHNRINK